MEPDRMLESGQILAARYGLLRKLGEGRVSQVWQARDRTAGVDCVIKVLTDPSPAGREQFLRAARLQQDLHHPRLQRCESVDDGEPPFAVFTELASGDLTGLRGRPWRSLLPVLAGVAEGLAALHARGLVHRDLKPANVLVGGDGAPLIADFGLAAQVGDAGAPRGGSPFSTSPQQLDGAPPARADDVYAFGVLAYELITGYPPFYPDPTPARVRDERPAPLAARFGVPDAIDELVRRCLAKAPEDRPGDLGATAATLRALADAAVEPSPRVERAPVALRPPMAEEPSIAPQWSRQTSAGPTAQQLRSEGFRRGLVAATFVILLLGAGFVFFLLPRWVERGAGTPAPAAPPAVTAEPASAPAEPQKDLERLAEAKREYEELRPGVVQRLDGLEARAAGAWGGEAFARGKRALTEADAAFGRREHEAALARLRAADADLAATEKLAAEQLRAALSAGAAALEQGDAATARAQFERALQIEPANAVAKRGLERTETIGEVTALLAEARAAEERGEGAVAEVAYRKALALDRDTRAARDGLARLQAQAGSAVFAAAMSQGLDALARRDYAAARAAFERAGKVRPGAPEVADGLAQVERAVADRTLAAHVQAAQQAERGERWAEALAEYRKALAIDRNLALAQQGLERAEPRAMLDAELAAYLDRPERLFSPDVRAAARTAIARARGFGEPGPALNRQIARLEDLITAAETPQRVALTSDNQTDVTVYRVGRIGTFERKELELLPGRYTVVGMRAGYRDVRRELTLLPGREAPTLAIRCEEPI
jgi:eukaryotic-like serine/threonine-protein kinase